MELIHSALLDCQGRETHRVVLGLDGSVRVTIASSGVTAIIDPKRRIVLTPGVRLPDEVMMAACALGLG